MTSNSKVALITGAGSGIGKGVAIALHKEGYTVVLAGRKYNIACGQIDIGNAMTDMAIKMTQGIIQANGTMAVEPTMPVADVASAVVYMASLPLTSNVLSITVMATAMPFVGRG